MRESGHVLLTGATGFLGRYLLRDLLTAGRRVAVLARPSRSRTAAERVAALVEWCQQSAGRRLSRPTILTGELSLPHLGLEAAEERWVGKNCRQIIHAAARTALRGSSDGEPARSNVEGTQRLLDLCARLGVEEFHHLSTAFVCGDRAGPIGEEELDCGQGFHNDYERSKCEAERRVRQTPGIRATIYRPSVIVGDSGTGHTSVYQGFYRFLELADRLAEPAASGRRLLPVRLPYRGDEPRDLVPVDWVSRAVVTILDRPAHHGQTFHLVAPVPVRAKEIKRVAEDLLGIDGVAWAGPGPLSEPTALEELFRDGLQEYWPYFQGDPAFDCRNTRTALPDLPAPQVDAAMLSRLIRFAAADRWGRAERRERRGRASLDCAYYLERFFPEAAPRSRLARLPLDAIIALDIAGGGQWSCEWQAGQLVEVRRGSRGDVEATYRLDTATFDDVVRGKQSPQEAFFARRIEVRGNLEKALKLAVLFGHFVQEFPYSSSSRWEDAHVAACPG